MKKLFATFMTFLATLAPASVANADPCGMVPPIYLGPTMPIARIGLQQTYVFYKGGFESLVIRPGFEGKVDEFGMLIPFPSPPAIRKVADDVFPHIAAAVDPPKVVVDLRQRFFLGCCDMAAPSGPKMESLGYAGRREAEEVQVIREEAVGMYEVAVLEAGSARALSEWMDDHGFRYPDGMDEVCEEYVDAGWCFVAVKARVGGKAASDPRPGMRSVDNSLPEDATFDGYVQAMGFRFRTDEFVVPMRLSAFNQGELRNVVYILSDGPKRVANLPEEFVVRQLSGHQLHRNLTDPLPLEVIGGNLADIPEWQRQGLPAQRDPAPHNGIAREVFASDLLAVRTGQLALPHEELEKELLDIGERLGLRGPELDALHHDALAAQREEMISAALADLNGMTLTVVDGDFPREVIAAQNLEFVAYTMPAVKNRESVYDVRFNGKAPTRRSDGFGGLVGLDAPPDQPLFVQLLGAAALLGLVMLLLAHRPGQKRVARISTLSTGILFGFFLLGGSGHAQESGPAPPRCEPSPGGQEYVAICCYGDFGVQELFERARTGGAIVDRGRAIVSLMEIGGETVTSGLRSLQDTADSALVQTWASAALVHLAASARELAPLSQRTNAYPALVRPLEKRWIQLLDDEGAEADLDAVLAGLANAYPLQQKLLPRLLQRDTDDFVAALLAADDQGARNLAAGCLATLAAQGREGVQIALLSALAFDPDAALVPWSGGPLFLPSCSWTNGEAKRIFRELVAWHLFCDRGSLREAQTQIHNALNSWGLANAAGYTMPGNQLDTTRWLLLLGETLGEEELRGLLAEQGLENHYRYRAVLTLVSGR